jgi:hypothetical protein
MMLNKLSTITLTDRRVYVYIRIFLTSAVVAASHPGCFTPGENSSSYSLGRRFWGGGDNNLEHFELEDFYI